MYDSISIEMWLKKNELAEYIPNDDKYHSVHIDNHVLYVDGKEVLSKLGLELAQGFSSFTTYDKALSKEELEFLRINLWINASPYM